MKQISIVILLAFFVFTACNNERPGANKNRKRTTEKTEKKQETSEDKEEEVTSVPPKQLERAKALIASVSDKEIDAVDAKKQFKLYCSICHGIKGDLMVNGAKDLTVSKIGLPESVAQVYFGKGLMTPFRGIMKDAEIVAVANYIESLR